MKKVLFIDRDGTLIREPADEQIDSFEKLEFLPGVISAMKQIAEPGSFELVMVTNQDGLGTSSFPEQNFWPVHNLMLQTFSGEGIVFSEVLIDRSFPADNAPTRKPRTAMLTKYIRGDYDLSASFVIGDRETDIQLAQNLGCRAIFISAQSHPDAALSSNDWAVIARFLTRPDRKAVIKRKTSETDIELALNIDGSGKSNIQTGIGFFDHMLELFSKHSGIDLTINAAGDLHVDEHHTVEDTAIVLGQAIREALGDKRGIERYGFLLPMDESLAQVALDFSGRNELVWQAEFKREMIGSMPTELFHHFFKSFSDESRCNLNIKAGGSNEHHKIEGIFKAFARSIRMAASRTGSSSDIPSTKGTL